MTPERSIENAKPRVLMLATLDTKSEEAAFLRKWLESEGLDVIHMDTSIREKIEGAEIPPEEVAAAASKTMDEVRALKHEGKCQAVMMEGAIKVALALDEKTPLSGIIAVGGSMGTTLSTAVMRVFPYGLPKVMISTMASGMTAPFVGTRDITMVNAVCDISGINSISHDVFRNAALAVSGMAKGFEKTIDNNKPLVLMGALGTTEKCCKAIRTSLEDKGYEVIVFHTTGAGGPTLDQVVRERPVSAVLDISLTEVNDYLQGGLCSGGPDRSKAALDLGVPVIFAPGNCDFVIAGPIDDAKLRFPGRTYHIHNPALTAVRTNIDDLKTLVDHLCEITTQSNSDVSWFVPLRGFSNHDSPDGHLQDTSIPPKFAEYLRSVVPKGTPVKVLDCHINDAEFAAALVDQVVAITAQA